MQKQTKAPLTWEMVRKDLCRKEEGLVRFMLLPTILANVTLLPMAILLAMHGEFSIPFYVAAVFETLFTFPFLAEWGFHLRRFFRAKRGEFRVEEDTLVELREGSSFFFSRTSGMPQVLRFLRYGEYGCYPGHTDSGYAYSSPEDVFYVVIYPSKKPRPQLVYAAKIYQYEKSPAEAREGEPG